MATRPSPLVLCALLFGVGCLPAFDNPFDPLNSPDGAVRLSSVAQVGRDAVKVTWTSIDHPAINGWRLSRTNVGGTEGAADREDALALSTLEWVDDTATAGATYEYKLVAVAGETFSGPSPGVQVTVEAPPVLAVSVERTGVGEATVRWSPLPAWISGVFIEHVCPDGSCEPKAVGTFEATALSFVDAMDEGPTLAWRLTAEDGTGVRLDETAATTETFSFSLDAPYPDGVRRAIEDGGIVDVSFTPLPYPARYEGTLTLADSAGSPVVVESNADEFHFTGLEAAADYLLTIRAIGPNEKEAIPYGPSRIRARAWYPFEPDRPTAAPPQGTIPGVALWHDDDETPADRLSLLAVTPDASGNSTAVSLAESPMGVRGGFSPAENVSVPFFAPPFVTLPRSPGRWISPVSGHALRPRQSQVSQSLATAGALPNEALNGAAAAVNPDDDSIWLFGGRVNGLPSALLRRGVVSPNGESIQWSEKPLPSNVGTDLRDHAMAFHQGQLYVLGGLGPQPLFSSPVFLRWDPDAPTTAATTLTGGPVQGPAGFAGLHLLSDGNRLWASGGRQPLNSTPVAAIWTWTEAEGWKERSANALGPAPTGADWAAFAWEFREGPGLVVYDGSAVFQFEPTSDSLEQFRWRRLDPPPADTALRGAYDVDGNTVFLKSGNGLWRYTPANGAGYELLAKGTAGDWPTGAIAYDAAGQRVLSYQGGNKVFSLDPKAPAPAFSELLAAAGGPPFVDVQLLEVGNSLEDFTSPTVFAVGSGLLPLNDLAVWSARLDGSSSWQRHDQGAPEGFLLEGQPCFPAPLACWDPRGPSVHALGVTGVGAAVTVELWSVNLGSGNHEWARVLTGTINDSCPRLDAMACAHGEGAVYVLGVLSGKNVTWRVNVDGGDWGPPLVHGSATDPGARTRPLLLRRHPWNDFLLFGGRTPVGHDVWQLETR